MHAKVARLVVLAVYISACIPCFSQANSNLQNYFKKNIGLSNDEIRGIRAGTAFAKAISPRTPAEVFVFGAVYVNADPATYVGIFRDFQRLRTIPSFLSVGVFSSPPRLPDVSGLSLEEEDLEALRECKPADCEVQLPDSYIQDFRKSVDWSSPTVNEQINRKVQQAVIDGLTAYQRDGNGSLGIYHDSDERINVAERFKYMLSYSKVFPSSLPAFHRYLLDYPKSRPSNTEDAFYWAKVDFGLKPTVRVIHAITMKQDSIRGPNYVIAEKQLYASHYFQTAMDLTFCISENTSTGGRGFYLVKVLGSEQAGLTGFTGSILRTVAVSRSVSSLRESLMSVKNMLEKRQ